MKIYLAKKTTLMLLITLIMCLGIAANHAYGGSIPKGNFDDIFLFHFLPSLGFWIILLVFLYACRRMAIPIAARYIASAIASEALFVTAILVIELVIEGEITPEGKIWLPVLFILSLIYIAIYNGIVFFVYGFGKKISVK